MPEKVMWFSSSTARIWNSQPFSDLLNVLAIIWDHIYNNVQYYKSITNVQLDQYKIRLSNFPFTFHFPALEKEMATHSSVLAWRIPGTGQPGGLLSMGLHRVRHDWSNLAAAATAGLFKVLNEIMRVEQTIKIINAIVDFLILKISRWLIVYFNFCIFIGLVLGRNFFLLYFYYCKIHLTFTI